MVFVRTKDEADGRIIVRRFVFVLISDRYILLYTSMSHIDDNV